MKRFILPLCILILVTASCKAEGTTSLQILGVVPPDDTCLYAPPDIAAFLPGPTEEFDPSGVVPYKLALGAFNTLNDPSQDIATTTDTSRQVNLPANQLNVKRIEVCYYIKTDDMQYTTYINSKIAEIYGNRIKASLCPNTTLDDRPSLVPAYYEIALAQGILPPAAGPEGIVPNVVLAEIFSPATLGQLFGADFNPKALAELKENPASKIVDWHYTPTTDRDAREVDPLLEAWGEWPEGLEQMGSTLETVIEVRIISETPTRLEVKSDWFVLPINLNLRGAYTACTEDEKATIVNCPVPDCTIDGTEVPCDCSGPSCICEGTGVETEGGTPNPIVACSESLEAKTGFAPLFGTCLPFQGPFQGGRTICEAVTGCAAAGGAAAAEGEAGAEGGAEGGADAGADAGAGG